MATAERDLPTSATAEHDLGPLVLGVSIASGDLDPAELDKAVAASHAAPAPSDPVQQDMAAVIARLETAEAALQKYAPVIEAMEAMLAVEVPAAGPIIGKVTALEQWALSVIDHFQGKIPAIPTAPPAA
jgi:hypothetical protein